MHNEPHRNYGTASVKTNQDSNCFFLALDIRFSFYLHLGSLILQIERVWVHMLAGFRSVCGFR